MAITIKFQSAPPRGGRQAQVRGSTGSNDVSIRAPARGATVRGIRSIYCVRKFQSAPPRGGRLPIGFRRHRFVVVSIRAPARGATGLTVKHSIEPIEFQSAPPRGGRQGRFQALMPAWVFQSAPPRGGRPSTPVTFEPWL